MIRKVPSEFRSIHNDKIEFEDDRIFIRYVSSLLDFIIVVFSFALAALLLIWYYKTTQSINGTYFYVKGDPRTWWGAIFFFVLYITLEKCIRIYHVIDFPGECFYRELFFFGLSFAFFVNQKDNIINIGNNIVPKIFKPKKRKRRIDGKSVSYNYEINSYESFQISFLLKNGKTYDMELGFFQENYHDTIRFVSFLSKYWGIPYIVCEANHHLIVNETRNNCYEFITEKIPYCSFEQKLFYAVICLIIALLLAVVLSIFVFK